MIYLDLCAAFIFFIFILYSRFKDTRKEGLKARMSGQKEKVRVVFVCSYCVVGAFFDGGLVSGRNM